jgi:hypothetical protein
VQQAKQLGIGLSVVALHTQRSIILISCHTCVWQQQCIFLSLRDEILRGNTCETPIQNCDMNTVLFYSFNMLVIVPDALAVCDNHAVMQQRLPLGKRQRTEQQRYVVYKYIRL